MTILRYCSAVTINGNDKRILLTCHAVGAIIFVVQMVGDHCRFIDVVGRGCNGSTIYLSMVGTEIRRQITAAASGGRGIVV